MKERKTWIWFLLVLIIDFAKCLFNFIRYFEIRENSIASTFLILLHFVPLVALGLVTFKFSIPYVGFLFYSKNWWFCIVYMIRYEMYDLALDFVLYIFYWVSYAFLLVELSKFHLCSIRPPNKR